MRGEIKMKRSALIIINPSAGKEDAGSYEDLIREELKDKDTNLIVKYTRGEGDATKFARQASEYNFDLVVSLGGDGTLNETVNGLASFKTPPMLGIIPLGTVNMYARVLNIPINTEKAIKLLNSDYYQEIDVGLANDKYFTNIVAVGPPAKAIYDVDIEDKTKLGFLAYVIAVGKEIIEDDVFPVKLKMDEITWEGEISIIVIGLLDSLAGLKTIASDGDISDWIMHIVAIKHLNISELMGMTAALTFGTISESDNIKYFKSKTLKLSTLDNSQFESNIDGDKGPKLPLEIKVLPKHLKVISKE